MKVEKLHTVGSKAPQACFELSSHGAGSQALWLPRPESVGIDFGRQVHLATFRPAQKPTEDRLASPVGIDEGRIHPGVTGIQKNSEHAIRDSGGCLAAKGHCSQGDNRLLST